MPPLHAALHGIQHSGKLYRRPYRIYGQFLLLAYDRTPRALNLFESLGVEKSEEPWCNLLLMSANVLENHQSTR